MAGRRGSTFIRVVVDNAGANRRLDQTTQKVRGIGPAAKLAAGAAVAAFGAIAAAIAGSVGPAAEFQTGLAEIATLSEDAKSSIGAIGDSVKEVAVTFGQDLKDSTKAAYDAISAGIPTKEVGNFLKTAARAATGGLVDIATSVDVLTTSVNAWAKENLTAERASDILFSVVQRGKTTYEQLAGSLSNVANIAAAADISLEEVGAAVASLTAQGVPTSEAMTQIRGAVQGLIRDTPELIRAFNQAGYASGEAAIRAIGFGGAAGIVARAANGSLGAIQKMVGSVEGMNAVLGVTGSNLELFNENLEATRRSAGVSERAFNQLANTFEFQRRRVMQGFQLLRTELGSLFLPVLTEVAKVVADFFGVAADSSGEEGEETKSQFERIKEAVIAVKDSFAELLTEVGKFTRITGVFDPLVAAWEAAKKALGITGPIVSVDDLLPADTSLAGWVEALGFEIRQALSSLAEVLRNQALRDFVSDVVNILKALFSGGVSFATAGKAFGRVMLDLIKDAIPGLKTTFKDAVVVDLFTDLENIIAAYLSGQVEWKTASAAFQTVITDVFKVAAANLRTALEPATTAVGDFVGKVETKFPNTTTAIKNIAAAIATLTANVTANTPTWSEFRDGFTQTLVDRVSQIAGNAATLASEADKLGGKLAEKLQPAFQWIKDNLPTIDARFAGVALALGAFAAFVRFFNPVGAALSVIVAALATDWGRLNDEVTKLAREHGLDEIWKDIEKALSDAAMTIRNFLSPVADVGDYAGNAAVDLQSLVLALRGFSAQQAPFDVLIGAFNRLGASISTNQAVMDIITKHVLPPFREAWEELVSAWNDNKEELLLLATVLATVVAGSIAAVIRGIGGILRIVGGLVRVGEGLLGIFHAIAAVFYDTDRAGAILKGSLETIGEGLLQIVRGLGPAILAALSFTPIGRGITLLGGRIAAFVRQKIVDRLAQYFLGEGGTAISNAFLTGLNLFWTALTGIGARLARALGVQVQNAGKTLRTGFAGLIEDTLKAVGKDLKKFNILGALLKVTFVSALAQVPATILSFIVTAFDTTLAEVSARVAAFFETVVDFIRDPAAKIVDTLFPDFVEQRAAAWQQWWSEGYGRIADRIREVISGLGQDFDEIAQNWAESSLGRFTSWTADVATRFDEWQNEVLNNFQAWSAATLPIVDDWAAEQLDKFYDWQNQVLMNFLAWVRDWSGAFAGWAADSIAALGNWVVETANRFDQWQNEQLDRLRQWSLNALAALVQWAANALSAIGTWVANSSQAFANWASRVWNQFTRWVANIVSTLTSGRMRWEAILAAALAAIVLVLTRGRVRALGVITGMITAITRNFQALQTTLVRIWTTIVSAIGSGAGRIRGYVDGALAGVRRIISAARRAAQAVKDVPVVGGVAGAIANRLPSFQGGGIVPGRLGQPVPILAHGGEEVIPAHERGRGGITINILPGAVSGNLVSERQLESVVASGVGRALGNRPDFQFV